VFARRQRGQYAFPVRTGVTDHHRVDILLRHQVAPVRVTPRDMIPFTYRVQRGLVGIRNRHQPELLVVIHQIRNVHNLGNRPAPNHPDP
jgi:hypothetical protein